MSGIEHDYSRLEAANPGFMARPAGKIIELIPQSELSQEQRDALAERMAALTITKTVELET